MPKQIDPTTVVTVAEARVKRDKAMYERVGAKRRAQTNGMHVVPLPASNLLGDRTGNTPTLRRETKHPNLVRKVAQANYHPYLLHSRGVINPRDAYTLDESLAILAQYRLILASMSSKGKEGT